MSLTRKDFIQLAKTTANIIHKLHPDLRELTTEEEEKVKSVIMLEIKDFCELNSKTLFFDKWLFKGLFEEHLKKLQNQTKCYSDHNEDIRVKGSCDYCGGEDIE